MHAWYYKAKQVQTVTAAQKHLSLKKSLGGKFGTEPESSEQSVSFHDPGQARVCKAVNHTVRLKQCLTPSSGRLNASMCVSAATE